jgi:hypothetical protein
VRREEGDTVLLEVRLVGIEHAVEPWQELLGAVVRVEDDGDTVVRGDGSNVVGSSGRSSDGGLLVAVGKTLTTEESGSSLRELEDDRGVDVPGGLEDTVHDRRRSDVDGGDGKLERSALEKSVV